MRERDRKVLELEKALAGEKKKREGADAKLKEVKIKADAEAQKVQQATQDLQVQANAAQNEAQRAKNHLAALEGQAGHKEEELVSQLEQCRNNLGRVAEEYGRLASVTVPIQDHRRLKYEYAALSIHALRLERKLANTEGQVVELVNLIRHTKEQNAFLSVQWQDARDEIAFYARALRDTTADVAHYQPLVDRELEEEVACMGRALLNSQKEMHEQHISEQEISQELYRLMCGQLLFTYSALDKALTGEQQVVQCQTAELTGATAARNTLISQLDTLREEYEDALRRLDTTNTDLESAKSDSEVAKQRADKAEAAMRITTTQHKEALQKEREATQRLAATTQMTKMSEEGLRAEVEQ